MGRLAATFLATFPGENREIDLAKLESLLETICRRARERWPGVELDDETFVQHLAARVPAGDHQIGPLESVHGEDLFLACACARGVKAAHELFDRRLLSRLPALLSSMNLDRNALDEARQLVAQRLLVAAPGEEPRIADYAGRGPLEGWVRVAAIRCVLNARPAEARHKPVQPSAIEELLGPAVADAELEQIKRQHKEDFVAALRAAAQELSSRERALLALHYVQGVPTIELGPLYGVHRTTVGRWLDSAQQSLLDGTRRQLMARLKLSDTECDSLIALLRSRIELTLGSLLQS